MERAITSRSHGSCHGQGEEAGGSPKGKQWPSTVVVRVRAKGERKLSRLERSSRGKKTACRNEKSKTNEQSRPESNRMREQNNFNTQKEVTEVSN